MRKFLSTGLVLLLSLSIYAQELDSLQKTINNTRNISLDAIYQADSNQIIKSPVLTFGKGIGLEQTKEAYKKNRLYVDSIIATDSLEANIWRVYSYQAAHLFVQANESPKMAMSIFLPWFLAVFIIVLLVLLFQLLFKHTALAEVSKPENDRIKTVKENELIPEEDVENISSDKEGEEPQSNH
ncbi:MAG: hypothetical protein B7C24_00255 [Bacteroidetes bacterium 4572_77]|nr:MAG: hypothetical protein B7C24_00255 [Bacteroidetes bacterium 4572_77]